ncbi:MAG: glycosyltransferase family 2 protein [Clostridia bacterium]
MDKLKKIGIIIPTYNEEESLELLNKRLFDVLNNCSLYDFKVLFVNDGSSDESLNIIKKLRVSEKRIEYISFSRNFGKEIAVTAGLDNLKDLDAVIIIDADLQDPPELIPKLLQGFEEGYEDVYAQRESRKGETFSKKLTSKLYYIVLQKLTKVPIQKNTGDYRLLSKKCVNAICDLREVSRCNKSAFSYVGFKKKAVLYNRDERVAGKTKWNYAKLIDLAIDGITSLSVSPLRIATYINIPMCIATFIYLITLLLNINNITLDCVIILLILFIAIIQLFVLGIIGEYLGRIFLETKKRPLYFIEEYSKESKD